MHLAREELLELSLAKSREGQNPPQRLQFRARPLVPPGVP
jgi:hypothetical protein